MTMEESFISKSWLRCGEVPSRFFTQKTYLAGLTLFGSFSSGVSDFALVFNFSSKLFNKEIGLSTSVFGFSTTKIGAPFFIFKTISRRIANFVSPVSSHFLTKNSSSFPGSKTTGSVRPFLKIKVSQISWARHFPKKRKMKTGRQASIFFIKISSRF